MMMPHLNGSQIRVQAIKDDLKNIETSHIDSYLEGISDPEPPHYRIINGKTEPQLEKITLKEKAKEYEIGNVVLSEDGCTNWVKIIVENGEVEFYSWDAEPKDISNKLTIPIPDSVLLDFIPLFDAKFMAIKNRLTVLNDLRAFAFNAPRQPSPRLSHGKTLKKLAADHSGGYVDAIEGTQSQKRSRSEAVQRAPTNKRKYIGLQCVPDSVKSEAFSRISEEFRVELFDAIAKAAVPNFNDIVMAAWNVVSLYEVVGSEHISLHKVITELRAVLVEFESVYRKDRKKARKTENEEPKQEEPEIEQQSSSAADVETPRQHDTNSTANWTEGVHNTQTQNLSNKNNGYPEVDVPKQALLQTPKSTANHALSVQSRPRFVNNSSMSSGNRGGNGSVMGHLDPENIPKRPDNTVGIHQLPPAAVIMANEEKRKRDCIAKLTTARRQIDQFNSIPSIESDPNGYNKSGNKQSNRSIRQLDGIHERIPRKSTHGNGHEKNINHEILDITEDDDNEVLFGNNTIEWPGTPPPHFLGQSKLGRPKTSFHNAGGAPEAPMAHTIKGESGTPSCRSG